MLLNWKPYIFDNGEMQCTSGSLKLAKALRVSKDIEPMRSSRAERGSSLKAGVVTGDQTP